MLRSSTTFFAKQCTRVEKSSKLPIDFFKRENNLLSTILFTKDDVAKIIKNLTPKKAHGFDMISICLLKISSYSVLEPLEFVFILCIDSGKFPIQCKKANVVQVHKK